MLGITGFSHEICFLGCLWIYQWGKKTFGKTDSANIQFQL